MPIALGYNMSVEVLLTNSDGTAKTGTFTGNFTVWNSTSMVFTNVSSVTSNINGRFQKFYDIPFFGNETLWAQWIIGDTSSGIKQLGIVPYAMNSQYLQGKSLDYFNNNLSYLRTDGSNNMTGQLAVDGRSLFNGTVHIGYNKFPQMNITTTYFEAPINILSSHNIQSPVNIVIKSTALHYYTELGSLLFSCSSSGCSMRNDLTFPDIDSEIKGTSNLVIQLFPFNLTIKHPRGIRLNGTTTILGDLHTNQSITTKGNIVSNDAIEAQDWTNVSITESQVSDLQSYLQNNSDMICKAMNISENMNLHDNVGINFGSGGLSGALGADSILSSDGGSTTLQIESPSGVYTNPKINFSYHNFLGAGLYVPVIGFPDSSGLAILDHNFYIKDLGGASDGNLVITDKDYPTDNSLLQFTYDSDQNVATMYSLGTTSQLTILSGIGYTNFTDDNLITKGNVTGDSLKAQDWSNVTITESQISDLSHTTDTYNETQEMQSAINDSDINLLRLSVTENVEASGNITADGVLFQINITDGIFINYTNTSMYNDSTGRIVYMGYIGDLI